MRRLAPRVRLAWCDPRVDALIDCYVAWREECGTVEASYRRWTEAECSERGLSYAAYRAALDREEKAAAVYRRAAVGLAGAAREQAES